MAKVSKGMWEVAPNTSVDWAVETFKAEALEDSLRVVSVRRGTPPGRDREGGEAKCVLID
jgi:hypothetical protein